MDLSVNSSARWWGAFPGLACVLAGCGVDAGAAADGRLGEAHEDMTVGTTPTTDTESLGWPGDHYGHAVTLTYGGTCTFKTIPGTLADPRMTIPDPSGRNSPCSNASVCVLALDPGTYPVTVRDATNSHAGSYTLSVSCADPVFFYENFVGNGDISQCNALGYGVLDAPMGAWTPKVRIDTDNRSGGCTQQFGVYDPLGLVQGLTLNVNFYATGDANQCGSSGNHPTTSSSSMIPWSSPYLIDTDNRPGGCYQVFNFVKAPAGVVLDIEFLPDGDPGQCWLSGTQTVTATSQVTFGIDTDGRPGGCTERFRLRRCAGRTSCNPGECGPVSDGCGGTLQCTPCGSGGGGGCLGLQGTDRLSLKPCL